jgi:bifunctional DNA-binding transcriptional regulator/antitoxin component of YhaV-PrlF toxin-antitoxin module
MRKIEEQNIRKLTRTGKGSISVTIPIEIIRQMKWKEKQKVVVKKTGSKIVIEDWKK